jgi:hypothetical protein
MFYCYLPDTPPETFQEKLWRLGMTEDEYYEHLKDMEEAEVSSYIDQLYY